MSDALLEFREATIRFGGLTAVAPLSFGIARGQLAAIIGPNGAGKTTIFNLITGVYAPSGGEIWFDGARIASSGRCHKPHTLARSGIARTFQNIRLFGDLSVEDNVRCAFAGRAGYGLGATLLRSGRHASGEASIRRDTAELLKLFQLEGRGAVPARSLPYGDQRRLEIARAMATRPQLLLLDEPTSGMNPTETEEVTRLIQFVRAQFGLTVLLIEHHMSLVMGICERILVLDGGVKIADDVPAAVQNNKHVIAAYLGEPDAAVDEAIAHGHAVTEPMAAPAATGPAG
jgi:branched-chain amino acid transport system ATP-binding protein